MGSEDPRLAFGVFRGIKSSTFKYFGMGSTFGPLLTTLCQTPGPGVGPKQRQNEGFWGIPDLRMEPFRVPEWSKMGPKWVILGYFEVLLFLLKRFDSLLRARAKVYSRYYLTSPRARIDPSGVYLDPPRRLSL